VTSGPSVVVHADADLLAAAAAARLVTGLVDAIAARGGAHLVLTGGRSGTAVMAALAGSPARDAVEWRSVHLWWGDERFLPAGHPDRNETQAREALLDALPLDPAKVHPMPASDGAFGDDVDAAAGGYAEQLLAATGRADRGEVPDFDILLLGVGPDAHVASLFPSKPEKDVTDRLVVGVPDAGMEPSVPRISLSLPALNASRHVVFLVTGPDKAEAVRRAFGDPPDPSSPAAHVRPRGGELTVILDPASAGSP
jgi:6-phosphogluconolactonase